MKLWDSPHSLPTHGTIDGATTTARPARRPPRKLARDSIRALKRRLEVSISPHTGLRWFFQNTQKGEARSTNRRETIGWDQGLKDTALTWVLGARRSINI